MKREHIIEEIKRTTKENNGVPLGMDRFFESTGIKRTDWEGKLWTKWSDAIIEAGFTPNKFSRPAYELDIVLVH